jgi:hypothetical protein
MILTAGRSDDAWLDLVVSILAVNQYSLEKTYRFVSGFRQQGLCDPSNLASWDQQELVGRLTLAGCDRGRFMTNLFALRLSSLGVYVGQNGVEHSETVLSGPDRAAIETFLLAVPGIGPKVVKNFFLLRGI